MQTHKTSTEVRIRSLWTSQKQRSTGFVFVSTGLMLTFNTQSAERSSMQQGGGFYSCVHLSAIDGAFENNRDCHYIRGTDDGH